VSAGYWFALAWLLSGFQFWAAWIISGLVYSKIGSEVLRLKSELKHWEECSGFQTPEECVLAIRRHQREYDALVDHLRQVMDKNYTGWAK
jgi:hypothetical protein